MGNWGLGKSFLEVLSFNLELIYLLSPIYQSKIGWILIYLFFYLMLMKSYWSRLLSLVLVLVVGLVGCGGGSPDSLTGDYRQDTLAVVNTLKQALELPQDSPDKAALQAEARLKINDFSARYQRNTSVATLGSFTTMRTALNSLAGHYSSYPNRPVPEKLKKRLDAEFKQVEASLRRGA
jgi:photosystem II Psb27 protein